MSDFLKEQTENKVFIIAELSANHNGSLTNAVETIRAAKRAGANAIKLQTYTAKTITINSKKSDFLINNGSVWDGKNLYELYEEAYTPWEWHPELFKVAEQEGLICFSSPFDFTSVDFLESFNVPCFKIASFEITDTPLIEYVASKGKPIILSTGIATKSDIELALSTIRKQGVNDIALLKCTSSYPAPIDEANLIMLQDYKKKFNIIPGLSDHTLGNVAPVVAVSLGAKIIEKHLILDKKIGGPDSSFSLDEKEFKEMVSNVRSAEKSIGKINYELTHKQHKGKDFARSLYVIKDVKKGERISNANVKSIRPGFGMHPKFLSQIIGKVFKKDIEFGTALKQNHFE